MAYLVERITSLDESVFDNLYTDSEEKINAGTIGTDPSLGENHRKEWVKENLDEALSSGFVLQVKKDDVIVFVAGGLLNGTLWECEVFLAGKDASGSRRFLYDTDWLIAMRDFHKSMASVYTEQQYRQSRNKSSETHYDQMVQRADADARFTHTATAQDIDINITTRKLTGIE